VDIGLTRLAYTTALLPSASSREHDGAVEDQELMSEGKNLSLPRCSSVKGLPSRRKQEEMIVSMSSKATATAA
jgi:hypothetical protein